MLVSFRVLLNLLDVAGLVFIGLLAALLSARLAGRDFEPPQLPILEHLAGSEVVFVAAMAAFLFFVKSLASVLVLRTIVRFLSQIETRVATTAVRKIFSSSLPMFRKESKGDILWAAQTSTFQATSGVLGTAASIVVEASLFIAIFGLFILVDLEMALLVTTYFVVLIGGFQVLVSRYLRRIGARLAEASTRTVGNLEDMYSAYRELRIHGGSEFFLSRFSQSRNLWATSNASQTFVLAIPRYAVETALLLGVFLLLLSTVSAESDAGQLIGVSIFLAGGLRMMGALLPLQNSISNLRSFSPQARKLQNILLLDPGDAHTYPDTNSEPRDKPVSSNEVSRLSPVEVRFDGVGFSYPGASSPIFKRVSFSIDAGSICALAGESGSGKSTLIDLILGLDVAESGKILVGGSSPSEFLQSSRRNVAFVPQFPGLVAGTVSENVALGVSTGSILLEKVEDALHQVGLGAWVSGLDGGIEFDLGSHADALSGGQRQRIGIARALYREASLILLDEVTTGLDPDAEEDVHRVIASLSGSATIVLASHRTPTLRLANKVLFINGGSIEEADSYDQLLLVSSDFRELFANASS